MMLSLSGLRLLLAATIAIVLLFQARPARADFDKVINELAEKLSDLFDELVEPLTGPIVQSVTRQQRPAFKTEGRFWQYLADAGYEVAAIETDVGLIPNVKVTLQILRELSEADRVALERNLLIDDQRKPGLIPLIERGIVHTLLEASQSGDMRVSKLVISLFPLPSADFTMTPAEGPLSAQNTLPWPQQGNAPKPVKSKPAGERDEPLTVPPKTVGE
jgi:hypothetical protein